MPHTTILATLPTDPSYPTRGIPHCGLTPTGAEIVELDTPVRVSGDKRRSWEGKKKVVRVGDG